MNKPSQLSEIFDALEFAAHKHQRQKRKGAEGIPYINHPIEVAKMIADEVANSDVDLLRAALLHDTLEDTSTSREELEMHFGSKVRVIVMEVSDNMKLSSAKRKRLQHENASKLSYPARCIRIADKACNIRDILHTRIFWSRKRKIDYIIWAKQVVNEIRNTDIALENTFDKIVKESTEILKHQF